MLIDETDAVGYPKRWAYQTFRLNGRPFRVIENKGLMVLCPCPDALSIEWLDTNETDMIENSPDFIPFVNYSC